ncbi:MAG: chloride channel protein [Proteobacteria bacterium]|nr:chloride channel protein [Pseudomonadota bacterium]
MRAFFKNRLQDNPVLENVPYWIAGLLVGIIAIFYSELFDDAIDVCRKILTEHPYWLLFISPCFFVLGRWIVEKFAPAAGGSGVPQVISALSLESPQQNTQIESILSLRVAFIVVLSSLCCILGAGALGREGPMVHIGACIFYVVGKACGKVWPFTEHRSWIMAGAAAGIAAAFSAPLAGVVFVLEELAQQHFHRFKTAVLTAAIIGGVVSQWLSGQFPYLGYPKLKAVPLSAIPWALGLGILAGLLSVPFLLMGSPRVRSWFSQYFTTRIQIAACMGFLVASIAIFVNPDSLGGGVSVIDKLLFDADYKANWSLVIARFLATTLSHLSGCAGGFLAPSLSLGAAIGSWFSVITDYSNHNLLVLVGMSAFLSAVVRAPFTAWVIVMEMTDRRTAIFPLMVASVVSYATSRFLQQKMGSKN